MKTNIKQVTLFTLGKWRTLDPSLKAHKSVLEAIEYVSTCLIPPAVTEHICAKYLTEEEKQKIEQRASHRQMMEFGVEGVDFDRRSYKIRELREEYAVKCLKKRLDTFVLEYDLSSQTKPFEI